MALFVGMLTVTGCDDDECENCGCGIDNCVCSGSASFSRTVTSSSSNVKNGDTVTLSLQNTGSVNIEITNVTGCDKCADEAVYTAIYFIDGKEVAKSIDKDNNFSVPVEMSGLAQGEHEVTATISVNYNCIKVSQSIIPCKMVVE